MSDPDDPIAALAPSLALVIPTYCRAHDLQQALVAMAPDILAGNIAVYISDDSPDDETAQAVEALSEALPGIRYRHNVPGLGHDRNIVASLLWPTEDYVWILGDSGRVRPGGFAHIRSLLDGQDFLFVNSHAEETDDIRALNGDEARRLVLDKLWHQALTGATIYSRRVLEWLRSHAPDARGLTCNFPHLSALVDFLADHSATVGWAGRRWTVFSHKKSYWRRQALSVFVEDWSAVVRRQPRVIPPEEQDLVLRSHDANTRLFSIGLLADLRVSGALSRTYLADNPDAQRALTKPMWIVAAIASMPPSLLAAGLQFIRSRRNGRQGAGGS